MVIKLRGFWNKCCRIVLYRSGHANRPQDHQKIKLDCNSTHSLIPCSVCQFKAEVSEDNWVLGSFLWHFSTVLFYFGAVQKLCKHFLIKATNVFKSKEIENCKRKIPKTKTSSDIWAFRHTQIQCRPHLKIQDRVHDLFLLHNWLIGSTYTYIYLVNL